MDRKELIDKYLNAETSPSEERYLADSFTADPPENEDEKAVCKIIRGIKPAPKIELPDECGEFDRIMRRSAMRKIRTWGLSVAGIAAAVAAVVLFTGKPNMHDTLPTEQMELADILRQLTFISNFDPAEAENYEFKPVGDGFVMTAHFPDGQTASWILTPLDGGKSFNLVSLNK